MSDVVLREIESLGCDVKAGEPMENHTTFKIGGPADYLVSVTNNEQLSGLSEYVKANGLTLRIIGNGSNLLVSDGGLRGVTAKLDGEFAAVAFEDRGEPCPYDATVGAITNRPQETPNRPQEATICAGAGAALSAACNFALGNSLTGMEFAFGIPGTVGGAVYMNAGAYGGEMKNIVTSVECFSREDNKIITIPGKECDFSYRHSAFMHNGLIILRAFVQLSHGEQNEIRAEMERIFGLRRDKQPLEYPSAGSVFRRPPGYFAGTLIEQSGLKGAQIGGAQVSEKHAGFIINKGGATCRDVLNLIAHVQRVVKDNSGVDLECEIKAIE